METRRAHCRSELCYPAIVLLRRAAGGFVQRQNLQSRVATAPNCKTAACAPSLSPTPKCWTTPDGPRLPRLRRGAGSRRALSLRTRTGGCARESPANSRFENTVRNLPQRVCDFLTGNLGRYYCDSCVQERLGLKWRQQVQLVTATLGTTELFQRSTHECCTCGQVKQATTAVKSTSFSVGHGSRLTLLPQRRTGDDEEQSSLRRIGSS